jgi:hypothetical protein
VLGSGDTERSHQNVCWTYVLYIVPGVGTLVAARSIRLHSQETRARCAPLVLDGRLQDLGPSGAELLIFGGMPFWYGELGDDLYRVCATPRPSRERLQKVAGAVR